MRCEDNKETIAVTSDAFVFAIATEEKAGLLSALALTQKARRKSAKEPMKTSTLRPLQGTLRPLRFDVFSHC